jgi:hypothetical protein
LAAAPDEGQGERAAAGEAVGCAASDDGAAAMMLVCAQMTSVWTSRRVEAR